MAHDLDTLRHTAAHVMAQAVLRLYPNAKLAVGPSIKDGFYHDFYLDETFSTDDLSRIEEEMRKIVKENLSIAREVWARGDATKNLSERDQSFTMELVDAIPDGEEITAYRQGEFVNICRGPHVKSTGELGSGFKLTKVSGAYWRGDQNNARLQRIYGTAWNSEKELADYLFVLEEAEKRNHLRLGKEMGLFHLQREAPGAVFWHEKGWTIYQTIVTYIREKISTNGYIEVNTPQLVSTELWQKSGHMEKYNDNMFLIKHGDTTYGLKPMNCPCHIQIFNHGLKSYRDLPTRMAEFGSCTRNEPSGALHGLMRVRSFVQDDAHIFCTQEQVGEEAKAFCRLLKEVYDDFGMECVLVRLSTRPEKRIGTDEMWDIAESALSDAATGAGIKCEIFEGEGAFYGPKLEFVLKDALGRLFQCGTLQLDYILPQRLDAHYTAEDGKPYHPVILHRAILGSLERFIGILLENYGGHLPLWLSPVQAVVTPISDIVSDYANHVLATLESNKIRAEGDFRNEKISYKIREHALCKVPFIFVVGKKEQEDGTVTIRHMNEQKTMGLDEAVTLLQNIIRDKRTATFN